MGTLWRARVVRALPAGGSPLIVAPEGFERASVAPHDCAPAVRWQGAEQWLQTQRGTALRAPPTAFALVSEVAVGRRKYALATAEAEAEDEAAAAAAKA
jgi:hypothetical protein